MSPVQRAAYMLAMPDLEYAQSVRRVEELLAGDPMTDGKNRTDILNHWKQLAGAEPPPPPSREERLTQLAALGIGVQVMP